MEDKVVLWRLGIVVLATLLMAATLILYFGRGFQPTYRLFVTCKEAPNVTPETPVQRNGILIGRVESVETLDKGGVRMSLRINKGTRLFSDEVARIGMTSILGESVIEFVPGRGPRERNLLVNGSELTDDSVEVMMGPMDILEQAVRVIGGLEELQSAFIEAGNSVKNTSENIGEISRSITEALGTEPDKMVKEFFRDVKSLSNQAESTMETYELLAKDVRDVIGTDATKDTLKGVIQKLPNVVDKADSILTESKSAITEFRSVAKNANERLEDIRRLTEPLADEEFVESLRDSLDGIGSFLSNVKDSKGTIGLLLNDPSVYNRLNNSLRRVETITSQIDPILRDVRVFTSKISTDPRLLGVKGAIDRRPSGSGVKGTFLGQQYRGMQPFER